MNFFQDMIFKKKASTSQTPFFIDTEREIINFSLIEKRFYNQKRNVVVVGGVCLNVN